MGPDLLFAVVGDRAATIVGVVFAKPAVVVVADHHFRFEHAARDFDALQCSIFPKTDLLLQRTCWHHAALPILGPSYSVPKLPTLKKN